MKFYFYVNQYAVQYDYDTGSKLWICHIHYLLEISFEIELELIQTVNVTSYCPVIGTVTSTIIPIV